MKFTSSVAGSITGIEFYRAAGDNGPDIAQLWSSTGTLLASGTFSNTSASGWQTVTFSSPVAITAGTAYVASYHSTGAYAATSNYFTSAHTSGSLTALSSTASGGNGVYAYGGTSTTGLLPTNSYQASNYFVDVVFNPQLTSGSPSAVSIKATPIAGIAQHVSEFSSFTSSAGNLRDYWATSPIERSASPSNVFGLFSQAANNFAHGIAGMTSGAGSGSLTLVSTAQTQSMRLASPLH